MHSLGGSLCRAALSPSTLSAAMSGALGWAGRWWPDGLWALTRRRPSPCGERTCSWAPSRGGCGTTFELPRGLLAVLRSVASCVGPGMVWYCMAWSRIVWHCMVWLHLCYVVMCCDVLRCDVELLFAVELWGRGDLLCFSLFFKYCIY